MQKFWFFLGKEKGITLLCLSIMVLSSGFTILQAGFIANVLSFTVNLEQARNLTSFTPSLEMGVLGADASMWDKVIYTFNLVLNEGNLTATRFIISEQDYGFYAVLGGILIAFVSTTQTLFFLRDFFNQYFAYRVSALVRRAYYRKALNFEFSYLRNQQSGDIISKSINDIKIVESEIYPFLESLVYGPIVLTFGLVSMFLINAEFTVILLLTFVILGMGIFLVSAFFKRVVKQLQERISDITVYIKNSLENIDVIKVFNRQNYENKIFSRIVEKHLILQKRITLLNYLNRPLSELFITIGGLVIIFYSSQLIWQNEITIASMFSFFSILIYIVPYVQRINNGFFLKQKISVSMERLFSVEDEEYKENDQGKDLDVVLQEKGKPSFQGNIVFKDLDFSYPVMETVRTLKGINLEIKAGEFVALVGESGGGKTTLLNIIPLLLSPQSGEVLYDEVPYQEITRSSVRKHLAFVPQENALFPVSVRENILYGKPEASEEEIFSAAKKANIHDVILSLPQGYDSLVGERGAKLSVGQKQRVAIARALVKDPRVLILDEATSALDSVSETQIQTALKKIASEKTIVAIAHRLSTILEADKIVVISKGSIIATGTHQELYAKNPYYQELCEKQLQAPQEQ